MNYLLLSIFMMLVTVIPRIAPGFLLERVTLGKRAKKFLNLIPFTAMSALIFPGVLSVDTLGRWYIGLIGALIAIGLSLIKKMPSALVVILSVLSLVGIYAII